MDSKTDFPAHKFGKRHRRKMLMFVPLMFAFIAAKAGVVLLLWNALVPGTFHGPELDYVQALELIVLVKVLVGFGGGFGGGRGRFMGMGGWGGGGRMMRDRWASLSPEEREKFRDELKRRFEGLDDFKR